MTHARKTLGLLGAALIGSTAISSSAFALEPLSQGYHLAVAKVAGEGECGEGKCSAKGKKAQGEGSCGAHGKAAQGEGSCGGDGKAAQGEGSCGAHGKGATKGES